MTHLLLDVCSLFLIRAAGYLLKVTLSANGVTQMKIKRCDTKDNMYFSETVSHSNHLIHQTNMTLFS